MNDERLRAVFALVTAIGLSAGVIGIGMLVDAAAKAGATLVIDGTSAELSADELHR